jgi:hypothetical protein
VPAAAAAAGDFRLEQNVLLKRAVVHVMEGMNVGDALGQVGLANTATLAHNVRRLRRTLLKSLASWAAVQEPKITSPVMGGRPSRPSPLPTAPVKMTMTVLGDAALPAPAPAVQRAGRPAKSAQQRKKEQESLQKSGLRKDKAHEAALGERDALLKTLRTALDSAKIHNTELDSQLRSMRGHVGCALQHLINYYSITNILDPEF